MRIASIACSLIAILSCSLIPAAEPVLPVIVADFETPSEVAQWRGLPVEQTTAHTSVGKHGLRFAIPRWNEGEEERPGIRLRLGGAAGTVDWSGFGKIAVDAWVEGDQPGRLGLKLRDSKGQSSWTTHFIVEPGKLNTAELLIADAAADSDIRHVAEVVLYALRPTNAFTLIVDNLRLLPAEKPPLATFQLDYPNYRELIFPEEKRVEVTVQVSDKAYDLKLSQLELVLSLRAGKREVSTKQRLRQTATHAVARLGSMPNGPITLQARLLYIDTGAELASQEWKLRKLTPAEAHQLKVHVDRDNNLVVDGRPFFPLGWYGSVNEEHLAELADSPFNCLLAYGTDQAPVARMRPFLDAMQQKGMKLVYCMNDVYPTATYFAGKTWEGLEGNEAIAAGVVAAYRDHPALLAWYLNDELPRELLPKLRDYYHRVREADPAHPCFIVLCNARDFPIFPPTTDILGVDPYPIPREPVTHVSDFADAANAAVHGSQPVWLVPQAFAWYQYNSKDPYRGHLPTRKELETGRAPTREEARCMTYLSLTHGAKGLIYYCYYDFRVLPQYNEMWAWMKAISNEVKTLSPVLLSPDDHGPLTFEPATAPMHLKVKRHQNTLYLLAVNSSTNACDIRFDLHRRLPKQATALFENRTVTVNQGRFEDAFAPLSVHVYEFAVPRH